MRLRRDLMPDARGYGPSHSGSAKNRRARNDVEDELREADGYADRSIKLMGRY
jgi:hypothetical protein